MQLIGLVTGGSQRFYDFANEEPQTLKRIYGALCELSSA